MSNDWSVLRRAWTWNDISKPPVYLNIRSSNRLIIASCCLAAFADQFFYGIIIPVLPFALTTKVGISTQDAQHWASVLLACYFASLLIGAPLCGWLADHLASRRLCFFLGCVALLFSTILLCIGSTLGMLIAGRLLGGVSSAICWTSGPGLLVDTVGKENVGRSMGYIALVMNVAYLLGPLLGGIVFDRCGYESVFVMMFFIILIDLILRMILVEKKVCALWERRSITTRNTEKTNHKYWISVYDVDGKPSLSPSTELASVSRFSWAYSGRNSRPISVFYSRACHVPPDGSEHLPLIHEDETVTTLAASRSPLPPIIRLLGSWRLLVALWANVVNGAILCGFDAVLPLFVHRTFGWGAIGAGLIFLNLTLPSFVAPTVGALTDKHGARWLTGLGFIVAFPSLVLLRLIQEDTVQHIVLLCSLLVILGSSMVLVLTPVMAEMTYIVEQKEREQPGVFGKGGAYAQVYGLYFCFFGIGALIGPLWAGYLEESAGWGTMTLTFGVVSVLTALPVILSTGGPLKEVLRRRRTAVDRIWPKMYQDHGRALSRDSQWSNWRKLSAV